jgi:hypothetical protein
MIAFAQRADWTCPRGTHIYDMRYDGKLACTPVELACVGAASQLFSSRGMTLTLSMSTDKYTCCDGPPGTFCDIVFEEQHNFAPDAWKM